MAEPSLIAENVKVVGTLVSSADVSINGMVNGDVHATGTVLVGQDGVVKGNIFAEAATVRGRVDGGLRARKVQLSSSCRVHGDILYARITIEDGARFEGNCRHAEDPAANAPKA